jgi:hypothetical protein
MTTAKPRPLLVPGETRAYPLSNSSLLHRRDCHHPAVPPLTAQPAQEYAHQYRRIQTIRLAKAARVGLSTVRDFEKRRQTPRPHNLAAIRKALENAGVKFIDAGKGGGHCRHPDPVRIAPPLRPDIIFGKDRCFSDGFSHAWKRALPGGL